MGSYVVSSKRVKSSEGSASRRWRREQERLEKKNQLKNKNFFIETAINFGNYYGSPFKNLKTSKKKQIGFKKEISEDN